jgi:hypothetical protein
MQRMNKENTTHAATAAAEDDNDCIHCLQKPKDQIVFGNNLRNHYKSSYKLDFSVD